MTRASGKVVMGVIGLDQHEAGAVAVSKLLTRHGFEVVYLGRFQTVESVVGAAVAEDADVIGVSCHSWEVFTYIGALVQECRVNQISLAVGGSVLTPDDVAKLHAGGVDAAFGAGASPDVIAEAFRVLTRGVRDG